MLDGLFHKVLLAEWELCLSCAFVPFLALAHLVSSYP